jgi:sugar transferase (PEP-CTERM system associated)
MIRIFSHYVSRTAFILLLLEVAILLVAAMLTSLTLLANSQHFAPSEPLRADNLYLTSLAFALVTVFSMSTLGMYQRETRAAIRGTLLRIMPSFGLGFVLLSILFYLVPTMHFGSGSLSLIFGLGGAGILLTRLLVYTSAGSTLLAARLILVGGGPLAKECIDLATSKVGLQRFSVVACVDVAGEASCVPAQRLLPGGPSLLTMARQYDAREIVVSVTDRRNGAFPVHQLLECALGGIRVIDAATFFEREACQIRLDSLQPSYLIYGGGFDQGTLRAASKRLFDLVASAAIFVAALPVMLLTALCIRLDDGGPVFYRQERVGLHGRIFNVLKFRSMRSDAEAGGTPVWASANDSRVTRVGKLLRTLRIDELPQMLNVLRGEMSFVGPRPERAFFVDQLCLDVAYYNIRHSIKPGITGLAQVRFQYGASVADAVSKLQYDLYYVKNNSLFLDLLILIETVQVVLFGKGSR